MEAVLKRSLIDSAPLKKVSITRRNKSVFDERLTDVRLAFFWKKKETD